MQDVRYLFLVGAPKCGTTSLAKMLDKRPEVCVASYKEPRYFTDVLSRKWIASGSEHFVRTAARSRDDWLALFSAKPGAQWRVDATTDYLSMPESAAKIAAFAEEVGPERVLVAAVLRDPVARAISEYQHTRRDSHQALSLQASLLREAERIEQGYIPLFHHVRRSKYADSVDRYRRLFGSNFILLDYHRLEDSLARLTEAMGLAPVQTPEPMVRANASYVPRSLVLRRILRSHKVNRLARLVLGDRGKTAFLGALQRYNDSGTARIRDRDIRSLRAALAEDIARCVHDPGIPTEHWTIACPEDRKP